MTVPKLLILVLIFIPAKFASGNVNVSSALSTNDKQPFWLSDSGEFAFGFHQINNTNLFLLAIWYHTIPEQTIVWNANSDNPAPTGSEVLLTSRGLTLRTPNGDDISIAAQNDTVSYGAMLDTGNFVLAANGNSPYVWESFKNPTDTLLPNQYLESGNKLSSRFSETNYTIGRFELYFNNNGNLLLSPIAWPTQIRYAKYYSTDVSVPSAKLVFNQSLDIYIEDVNGSKTQLTGWDQSSNLDSSVNYYRATLDFNGIFALYEHTKNSNGNQGWSRVEYVPKDICTVITNDMGSGYCGYNSYCTSSTASPPTCECPPGYSFIDPNNQFSGCQPDYYLGCGADVDAGPEELYNITQKSNLNWPLGDYERLNPSSLQECKNSCLYDCFCAAAVFSHETCWKKKFPLSNGRYESGTEVLFKTRLGPLLADLDPSHEEKKDEDYKPVLLGSLIGSLVVNGLLLASIVLVIFLIPKKGINVGASNRLERNLLSFTYQELEEATQGFSEELGRGSFGIVYKGTLTSGSNSVVAVKKLDRLAQEREREFQTELSAIGKTYHRNLVRLIGFCDERVHRLVVYEFMSNGTLADIIFGQSAKPIWNLRLRIALGIARGLVYLHEDCAPPIIHCDIKPQNILIDEYFTAKISDFGLAKLLLLDQSKTNTMIRGTRGYVAPEWFKNVPVTAKVDVYSFGVMLLEIICCRRSLLNESKENNDEKAILTDWAYDCFMSGRIDDLVEKDKEAMDDKDRVQKWVMIAIWCIQEHQETRPAMKTVLQMLEGLVEVPNPPSLSSFTFM